MKASGRGKTLVKGARETGLREGLLENYFEKMKLLVRKQTKSFKYEKLWPTYKIELFVKIVNGFPVDAWTKLKVYKTFSYDV